MKNFNVVFKIVNEKNCPLYQEGEHLLLSEKTLSCPEGKEVCLILVRDMTELLLTFFKNQPFNPEEHLSEEFNCSGCNGLIKFALITEDGRSNSNVGWTVTPIETEMTKTDREHVSSPFLEILTDEKVTTIFQHGQKIVLEKDDILISQGKQNDNLYIILEGELAVEDSGILLATFNKGEICGEMSYFGTDVAVSTVRAMSASKVLVIGGEVFAAVLNNDFKVQAFLAQLIAKRLRRTEAARARDFESCMSGRIDQIMVAELFQIFHMHQKTGVLKLELPQGDGHVSFREGCIINAGYNDLINEEAIFKILAEESGLYRFITGLSPQEMKAAEIGDFMMLLMEGVKRVDEDRER